MIQFKKFLLSESNSEQDISSFLSEHGDTIPKDNLYMTDQYFCAFWDAASDEEKSKKAILHQLKRDLLQLEVQRVQHDRKYQIARILNTKKGTGVDDVLNAKDEIETIEAQIQFTKEKLAIIENG